MFLVHRPILVGLDVGIASRVGFHDFSVDFSPARGLIKEEYKDKAPPCENPPITILVEGIPAFSSSSIRL